MSKNINNEIDDLDLEEEIDIVEEDTEDEDIKEKSTSKKKENKYSLDFEKAIKEYLDNFSSSNEIFKVKYESEKKSISECCNYIISEVQASGKNAFTDDEIFYLARHYYEEEDIKVSKSSRTCNVVVNRVYELTKEEKEKARLEAINQYKENELNRIKKLEQKKKEKEQLRIQKQLEEEKLQASLSGQMSLFMEDF